MTEQNGPNESAAPSGPHTAAGARGGARSARAARSEQPRRPRRRRFDILLLALVTVIVLAAVIIMLAPDGMRRWLVGETRPPSTTISVAQPTAPPPTATPSTEPPPRPQSAAPAPVPSATPAPTQTPAPALPPAAAAELQALRAGLDDLGRRFAALEQKDGPAGGEPRLAELESRLVALEGRLAGALEQPAVTPAMLADALGESRKMAEGAARDAAERAARDAAERAARDAVERAARESGAAAQDAARSLAELEKRVAAVEKLASAAAAVVDLERRVGMLEKAAPALVAIPDLDRRLDGLEKKTAPLAAIPDLDRRLDGLEKSMAPLAAVSQSALKGESLALGLVSLRLALDRGTGYADVLSALRVSSGKDAVLTAELERLAPFAATGVPTMAALRERLASLRTAEPPAAPPAKAEPAPEAPAEPGFWDGIWNRLSSVVRVRRIDSAETAGGTRQAEAEGDSLLARARARLARDDLAGAVALLDPEPASRDAPPPSDALQDWLRDARARLTAETAVANLARRSLALHGSTSPAAVPAGDSAAP